MSSNWQAWLDIAELVLRYGIPAVKEIIATWSDDMTPEEVKAKIVEYQARLKKPEDYFE